MKRMLLALVALLFVAACTSPKDDDDKATPTTPTTPSPTATTPAEATEPPAGDYRLEPGGFGPVKMGMTKQQAIATGLMKAGGTAPTEGCPAPELVWAPPFDTMLDVQLDGNKRIVSIGSLKGSKATTSEGIGIGDTLAEVKKAYPFARKPVAAGYGQSGVIVEDDRGYLGFLFNPPPAQLKEASTVSFIEVTAKNDPSLIRDGC